MNQSETLKIKIEGIREMLDKLNRELPFPGHVSTSIIKKYINELEIKLKNDYGETN